MTLGLIIVNLNKRLNKLLNIQKTEEHLTKKILLKKIEKLEDCTDEDLSEEENEEKQRDIAMYWEKTCFDIEELNQNDKKVKTFMKEMRYENLPDISSCDCEDEVFGQWKQIVETIDKLI